MRKLAVALTALSLMVSVGGCAASSETEPTTQPDLSTQSDPIKTADSRWSVALQTRATVNSSGTVTVDLTTGNLMGVGPNDPHFNPNSSFTHVWVWAFTGGKWHNLGMVPGGSVEVGPGGGCIHFRLAGLAEGDFIQIAATVKLPGKSQTFIGAVDTKVAPAPYVNIPSMVGEPEP